MEPETNPVSPTSQPTQPTSPLPEATTPAPTSISENPVSVPAPEVAPAPQAQAEAPVAAQPAPGAIPPVPPTAGTVAPVASSSSGSGKKVATTLLILSLLAGGAAAGYYYWMNMTTAPAAEVQATQAATSTESNLANSVDPTLRPTLEGVISSMNMVLATSSYESFIQTLDSASVALITKADFEKSKDLFKKNMMVDLTKTDFVDLKSENGRAGYYFLWPMAASSTTKTLGMIAFTQEATGWKISKMASKDIAVSADPLQIIDTDPDFSFSAMSAPAAQIATSTAPAK